MKQRIDKIIQILFEGSTKALYVKVTYGIHILLEMFYVLSFLWQLKREFNFYDGAKIGHLSKWTRYPPA